MAQENAIQAENTELWEKVFLSADKGMAMMEDGKNYGEFLLSTIEAAKEQFTRRGVRATEGKSHGNQKYRGPAGCIGGKIPQLIRDARRGWRHERTGGQRHDHAAR